MEEIDGRLAVVDVDSHGNRFVRFWIDDPPGIPTEERTTPHAAEEHVATRNSSCGLPYAEPSVEH